MSPFDIGGSVRGGESTHTQGDLIGGLGYGGVRFGGFNVPKRGIDQESLLIAGAIILAAVMVLKKAG